MLKIQKTVENEKTIFALEGRLDSTSAFELESQLKASIDGVKTLVFDFKDLSYISSAGLRVLLSAQKTMNNQGEMSVVNVQDDVMEIFELTGFSDILDIQ